MVLSPILCEPDVSLQRIDRLLSRFYQTFWHQSKLAIKLTITPPLVQLARPGSTIVFGWGFFCFLASPLHHPAKHFHYGVL